MRYFASYGTYEAANEHQLTLLAADIDALVEYVPPGPAELSHSEVRTPGYAVMVEEVRFAEAYALLSLQVQPDYQCLYACPKCGSDRVREVEPSVFRATLFLLIPMVVGMIMRRRKGIPYLCLSCGARYRTKIHTNL